MLQLRTKMEGHSVTDLATTRDRNYMDSNVFRGKSKRVHAEGHGRGLVELLPWNCCCRDGLLCVCFCPSQETKAPLSSAALFPGITNLSSEEKRWQRGKVDAAPFDYTLPLSDYILCSVTVLCTCPRQAWTFRRKTPNTWERVFLVMPGYVEFQRLFAGCSMTSRTWEIVEISTVLVRLRRVWS